MHRRLQAGEPRLGERIPCPEESLLRLEHVEEISHTLAILKLGDLKRLAGRIHFLTEMLLLPGVISDLA